MIFYNGKFVKKLLLNRLIVLIYIMFMDNNYQRTALITGGSNGIGNAIAAKLAAEKFRVVIADIAPPVSMHEDISYVYCDVTKGQDVDNLYNSVIRLEERPMSWF